MKFGWKALNAGLKQHLVWSLLQPSSSRSGISSGMPYGILFGVIDWDDLREVGPV